MGKKYLIDSNIIIKSATRNALNEKSILFLGSILDDAFNVSVISKIELLSKDDTLLPFIETSNVFPLTNSIIEETIKLRRKHKIKIPDAIIAATALVNNFILVTNNSKDFNHIKGLKITDPFIEV